MTTIAIAGATGAVGQQMLECLKHSSGSKIISQCKIKRKRNRWPHR